MAKTFVSPAVITREIDQSYLPAAVGSIGAAFIGTTARGPAFVPYTASTYSEAAKIFGDLDENHPMMYAVRAYMRNSAQATIVRVLGPSGRVVNGVGVTPGYAVDAVWGINAVYNSTASLQALIAVSGSSTVTATGIGSDLIDLRISGSNGYVLAVTASLLSSSANYIKKVLNTDPTQYYSSGYYLKAAYDYAFKLTNAGSASYAASNYSGMTNFQVGYNSASSPWVNSQEFGGSTEYNLFRFHTLGHGKVENKNIKIVVRNITTSPIPAVNPYGKFDVQVRAYNDTDRQPIILENFPSCDLNPASNNYVAKRIGDRFHQYDATKDKIVPNGVFENTSRLIRIEMTTGSYPAESLPWGFRGLAKPGLMVNSGALGLSAGQISIRDLPYVKDLLDKETQAETKTYVNWGVEYELSGNVSGRFQMLPAMSGSDTNFSLKFVSGNIEGNLTYIPTLNSSKKAPGLNLGYTTLDPQHAQFTVPVAFGFDGWDVRSKYPVQNETQLLLANQLGTQAIRQGVDCVKDPDFIDINMLVIPGIWSSLVTKYAISAVEERGDAFYIMDISGSDVTSAVGNVSTLGYDTNYTGCYYPSVKVVDPVSNKIVTVPASVPAAGAIAYTDRVAAPWYAPAGLNRGGLNINTIGFTVVEVLDRLKQEERDMLYDARINPIAHFPGEGIVVWGQKTLQQKASALDRINVRRLLIRAKKLIASVTKYLVFEANNAATWTKFRNLVNPILLDIQTRNGIEQFRVVMDDTTNTPDLVDRNIMAGQIYLKPTRVAEEIVIDFVISRTGATFSQ